MKTLRGGVRTITLTIGALLVGLELPACDDAILGERLVGCDGGDCTESGVTPPPEDGCSSAPSPPVCDAGTLVPRHAPSGCTVGYLCEVACTSVGGTCSTRAECPGGKWSTTASTDCASGQGCCRLCPPVSQPPAGLCDAGTDIVSVYEGDCVIGFACQ